MNQHDSDLEEETLVGTYQEQSRYEELDELDHVDTMSMAQQTDDIQSRLLSASQPLERTASVEVKFASYDNYCSLFHFILNSEGPVDLEPPSVRPSASTTRIKLTTTVLLGLGRD
jgi:translation initiation factor 3 subunit L